MSETTSASGSKSKAKKPLTNPQKGAIVAMGLVGVYFLYRWYQAKSSATTGTTASSTTPGSGTDANGVANDQGATLNGTAPDTSGESSGGSLDPATGLYYTNESPFSSLDPATGLPWGTEVDTLLTEVASLRNSTVSTSGTTAAMKSLDAWEKKARAQLVKDGATPAEAAAAVREYINGKSVTGSLSIANNLQHFVNSTKPPWTSKDRPVVVAKGVTVAQQEAALKKAEQQAAAASKDHNAAALKAAQSQERKIKAS